MTDPMTSFFKQLTASLDATAKPKTFEQIHAQMLALKADCDAFCEANAGTNYASDAISGLADLLSDHAPEFEAEIPTSSPPAEYYRSGGQGSV
jgi:hypothetical protein